MNFNRFVSLWACFAFFGVIALFLSGHSDHVYIAGAIAALMAWLWATQLIPLGVVSLLPLVLFPTFSIMNFSQTALCYAEPNVFLFMGGFFVAIAIEKCGLHRVFALRIIQQVGFSPVRLLAAFALTAAFISMWVSNTATVMMMLPVALAVIRQIEQTSFAESRQVSSFKVAMMLMIAYASSVGGSATLIGTPPNIILASQMKVLSADQKSISFVSWLGFGLPLAFGFLLIAWGYLAFFVNKLKNDKESSVGLGAVFEKQKPLTRDQLKVLVIFLVMAMCWIFKDDLVLGDFTLPGLINRKGFNIVTDPMIAISFAIILFCLPSSEKKGEYLLDWKDTQKMPWDTLLLFGAGFAIAQAMQTVGVTERLSNLFGIFQGWPLWLIVWGLVVLTILFSEIMSNSAQVTLMLPVMAALAIQLDVNPYILAIPLTLGASYAFMMPSGTPPNAIAISSGHVNVKDMMRAGLILNLLASFWITFIAWILIIPMFK